MSETRGAFCFFSRYERNFIGRKATSQKMSHAAEIPVRERSARFTKTFPKQRKSKRSKPERA